MKVEKQYQNSISVFDFLSKDPKLSGKDPEYIKIVVDEVEQEMFRGIVEVFDKVLKLTMNEVEELPVGYQKNVVYYYSHNGHAHGVRVKKIDPENIIYEHLDNEIANRNIDFSVTLKIDLVLRKITILKLPNFDFGENYDYYYNVCKFTYFDLLHAASSNLWIEVKPENQKIIQECNRIIKDWRKIQENNILIN
jgi:small nuclear ribonucleoprotein (snRNP)-like protein